MTNEPVHPAEREPGAGQDRPPLPDQKITEEKTEGWAGSGSPHGEDAGRGQPEGWAAQGAEAS
jgi:hypothetical protein